MVLRQAQAPKEKQTCELLLTNGADVNITNINGDTALILAAYSGHIYICEKLVTYGANTNAKEKHGISALIWAAYFGHKEICELLITNGTDINTKNIRGDTALICATWNRRIGVVQYLQSILLYQVRT